MLPSPCYCAAQSEQALSLAIMQRALHGLSHIGRAVGDFDVGGLESGHFFGSRAFAARDDSTCMTHPAAGRCGAASDESGNWLGDMLLDVSRRFFFRRAADFADHE